MGSRSEALERRVVSALPGIAAVGTLIMPIGGWLLRDRLSTVDKLAFAIDAVGYAAVVKPLSQCSARGWWVLTILTAIQPLFTLAKRAEGTGSSSETAGRLASTVGVLALLLRIKKHFG